MSNQKLSLYTKDELPTWDELYREFYVNKIFKYEADNLNHQELDKYWKRPHRKMLLMWVCNQLNKLIYENINIKTIFEDHQMEHVEPTHIKFVLVSPCINITDFLESVKSSLCMPVDGPPVIYTCKIPYTGVYSDFIVNDHMRKDIDEFVGDVQLAMVLINKDPAILMTVTYVFQDILDVLLHEVIKYYSGEIGWKDENGNLISTTSGNFGCSGSGIDPAL